jgi:hypothetical protein
MLTLTLRDNVYLLKGMRLASKFYVSLYWSKELKIHNGVIHMKGT